MSGARSSSGLFICWLLLFVVCSTLVRKGPQPVGFTADRQDLCTAAHSHSHLNFQKKSKGICLSRSHVLSVCLGRCAWRHQGRGRPRRSRELLGLRELLCLREALPEPLAGEVGRAQGRGRCSSRGGRRGAVMGEHGRGWLLPKGLQRCVPERRHSDGRNCSGRVRLHLR